MKDKYDEYKVFKIAQTIATEHLAREKAYIYGDDLFDRINKKGLEDAQALVRLLIKEVDGHNSKIEASITRIKNLDYMKDLSWTNKAFAKVNFNAIRKELTDDPEASIWDIAKKYV